MAKADCQFYINNHVLARASRFPNDFAVSIENVRHLERKLLNAAIQRIQNISRKSYCQISLCYRHFAGGCLDL